MIISEELFSNEISRLHVCGKRWVVGLSGGADSLCLTLLADMYCRSTGRSLHACIVDHKLRKESSAEIIPTCKLLEQKKIPYRVYVWEGGAKATGSIEQKARKARYEFLLQCGNEIAADTLMTAHHALDQWETFFMRLSRGSALKGLASIRPVSTFHNISLVRPLLAFSPDDIRETLRCEFGITEYVHDPSNDQLEFERVRWRKAYAELAERYGLDLANVCQTTERLQSADSCLDELAEQSLQEMFDGEYIYSEKFCTQHIELRMRALSRLIDRLARNAPRIVSYDLLKRTAEAMCGQNFKATNIAGLVFRRCKNNRINVALEER